MNRRDWLVSAGALAANVYFASPGRAAERINFGAYPGDPKLAQTRNADSRFVKISGIGRGKKALLWKFFEEATGKPLEPHSQAQAPDGSPGEGDCVGHGFALSVDVLAATDIYGTRHEPEEWKAKSSVEMIYAGSRVEIGGNQIRGGGSRGDWAAEYLQKYGVLHRLKYGDIDLTGYHPDRSRQYRYTGVPDELEPIAREHPVRDWAVVTTWEAAEDQFYTGNTIAICSTYAIHGTRDSDGFSYIYRGRGRPQWWHCMMFAGYDSEYHRPGVLLINSHGPHWINGPKRYDQPEGSCWLSPEDFVTMANDSNGAYCLSNYVGHPKKLPDHHRLY